MNLSPPPHPVGLFPQFVKHKQPVSLCVRERKTLSNDFSITNIDTDAVVLNVCGPKCGPQERKEFSDANGNLLFTLLKEPYNIKDTFEVQDSNGKKLFCIDSSSLIRIKLTATYTNPMIQKDETIVLKGTFGQRKATITCGEAVIGRISRDIVDSKSILLDTRAYALNVAPNVDFALLAAFTVALDAKYDDGSFSEFITDVLEQDAP
ncbi:tubby C-terminal-like domain-containing protein [Auriculariales sp. MPI-PUGE-AT-0066]|nr:tubby C-terminal-like domain-containing protein [Auriculariales sp. MPI-PUGE-AT-0066]